MGYNRQQSVYKNCGHDAPATIFDILDYRN